MNQRFDVRIGARQIAWSQPKPLPDASVPKLPSGGAESTRKQAPQARTGRRWKPRWDVHAVGGDLQLLGVLISRATAQYPQGGHGKHQLVAGHALRPAPAGALPLPTGA
jgi:hypothetical protein